MRLELTGRQLRITPALRRLVEEGLEKLDRLLHDGVVSMQVVLDQEKYRHRVEATLHARGENFFHGTGSGRDWEIAINQAMGKINQQARKLKGKWNGRKRRGAADQVGDSTDAFIVFRNPDTDAVTVLFRRSDGHLGLIEEA